jgi:hypothetical protein
MNHTLSEGYTTKAFSMVSVYAWPGRSCAMARRFNRTIRTAAIVGCLSAMSTCLAQPVTISITSVTPNADLKPGDRVSFTVNVS